MGRGRGRVQRVRVREPVFLGQQLGVLAFRGPGPLDLGQAAAQILGLGRPLPGRPGQLVELGPDLAVPLVGPLIVGEDGVQLRPGVPVQGLALPARPQQLLLVGLPVHGHQVVGQVGEQRDGDRPAARVGPRPALGRHRPAHDQRAALVVELAARLHDLLRHPAAGVDPQPALDGGTLRPGPDARRVRAAAEHQPQAGHDHGLARPGLAGDHREPG